MDTKQIEYILAIAKEKNMTRAAQTLYVSQPTLSQALAKLEQELGQPLFQREHSEMLPTQAGLDYIYTAKQVLELKRRLYQKIQIGSGQRHLEIGVSSHWAASMITRVIADMKHQNIPYFSLHIIDESPVNLLKKVWDKQLDISIITTQQPEQYPNSEVLYQEEILLAVPDCMLQETGLAREITADTVCTVLQSKNLPFVLADQGTALRKSVDELLLSIGVIPDIVCEIRDMADALQMTAEGLGLTFIPESRKDASLPVQYFSLSPKLYRYQTAVTQGSSGRQDTVCRAFLKYLKDAIQA